MKLLTKQIIDDLPPLYSQENVDDPMVVVKFFCPWSNWTWYVVEGSPVPDGFDDYLLLLRTGRWDGKGTGLLHPR